MNIRNPENLTGPACRCGVPQKPRSTMYGIDDGKCYRHPEKHEEMDEESSQDV